MISPKENYRNVLLHKPTEYVPCSLTEAAVLGFGAHNGPWFEKGPEGGGYDGFGVRWECPASGGGAAIPAPNEFLLEDIEDWQTVKFPDLDAFDWEADAARELANVNREMQMVEFGVGNGVFERLAALMGFEEALIALVSDPESCHAFFEKLSDYQIEYIRRVKQYYNPDSIIYYDDIATERGLFMSPQTYRELIKPYHKKIFDAVHEMGMFAVQHTCGKAQDVVEDMIEIGVDAWSSVQPTNDICALIEKYGDKISFCGGYDTNGPCSQETATPDMIINEVHRVVDTYGPYHKAFALFGFALSNNPEVVGRNMGIMFGEFMQYRMAVLRG